MIKIAKLKRLIFESEGGEYCVYSAKAGKSEIKIAIRGEQPKILKTVEYKLIGEFVNTQKYRTFVVSKWEKLSGRVNYSKSLPREI